MSKFKIKGPCTVSGEVTVSGSKNAALPLIAATILNNGVSVLTNVPDIADIYQMIEILKFLNVEVSFEKNTLRVDTSKMRNRELTKDLVCKIRGAIVFLGPLLSRFGKVKMAFPGGCVIGKRPADSHINALVAMGAEVLENGKILHLRLKEKKEVSRFTMNEMSVTATENVIAFASLAPFTEVSLCASEPHVQDLCNFVSKMGVRIDGVGSHKLSIFGKEEISKTVEHEVTTDYLEVGTFAIAAAVTGGHLVIKGAKEDHLDSFWLKMKEAGVKFEHRENEVEIFPTEEIKPVNLKTAVFPSFPTDLQAPFSILQCKADGISKIFETLFEKRLNYIFELEKMGVQVEHLNPHQAIIIGGRLLKGSEVTSFDLRAGAAMVLVALIAEGETTVLNVNYIDRGYEKFDEKLRKLGVEIERIE